jgi:hypothetical protein
MKDEERPLVLVQRGMRSFNFGVSGYTAITLI